MAYEIIFKCRSINNKNIREGELNILRKNENQLCFEFGENEMNIKKRFYKDLKTLNEDFSKLQKIKEYVHHILSDFQKTVDKIHFLCYYILSHIFDKNYVFVNSF